jgi:HD-GYP domain-containing protein (c-di-GMP phosphodiesterase class II)
VGCEGPAGGRRVRAAELIAALSLATDLGTGLPLEHGLQSTLVAMRLGDRLGVDSETASQTYYACLLFYIGCTADAEIAADLFGERLVTHVTPVMFGSRPEMARGILGALAPPGGHPARRAVQIARRLPRAVRTRPRHLAALCEVAQMLTDRLGLPGTVRGLFAGFTERWDGRGEPGRSRGDEIPLPVRIVHVARDAAFQAMLAGDAAAARVVRRRGGGAFDPEIAGMLAGDAHEILAPGPGASAWEQVLEREPGAELMLEGETVDRALAAVGDFADLACPYLVGHSAGVAALAEAAAARCGFGESAVDSIRRAAHVHDVGRVAVPAGIWQKPGPLTPDEWERVRLHAYHSERVLARSPFLSALAPVASAHHERLDGSGYHRGAAGASLSPAARLLAAADAYHAMTEPRPHRPAAPPGRAGEELGREARSGRLDADAVGAVLEAAGQRAPRIARPAGLTEREAEVVGLLARGLQTKQVARTLGISVKTADRHIQNAYGKIGVSTRAAAAVFAMEHGLVAWGEVPMARSFPRS